MWDLYKAKTFDHQHWDRVDGKTFTAVFLKNTG